MPYVSTGRLAAASVKRPATKIERRVDDSEMGQCLGKVPSKTFARYVVLLGQQSEFIAHGENAFKLRPRFVGAALQVETVGHPA